MVARNGNWKTWSKVLLCSLTVMVHGVAWRLSHPSRNRKCWDPYYVCTSNSSTDENRSFCRKDPIGTYESSN
eukprot:scaffold6528_cov114-Cylindrotheca_fusiformis.AAC.8